MVTERQVEYGSNRGSQVSSSLTESGTVLSETGILNGLIVKPDGINDPVINVFDNIAASGINLIPSDTVFDGSSKLAVLSFNPGVIFDIGLYVEITCVGTVEVQVLFNRY